MNIQSYQTVLRDLIAQDEIPAALAHLRELLAHSPKLDEVIHQSGRYENIRKQIRLGTLSLSEANLTQNQIRAALLDLLDEIETQGQTPALRREIEGALSILHSKNVVAGSTITAGGNVHIGDVTTVSESHTSRRLRLFLYLFVPLLALGAAFLWYRMQPVSLTVVADQTAPIPDLPFEKGRLVLYHDGKPDPKTLETETVFTGIGRGERVSLHFDAPGFVAVDSVFDLSADQSIRLPVRRDSSLTHLFGTVKDPGGNPVAGCQVIVLDVSALTDAAGRYALDIPYLQQRREQVIRAVKDGREGFHETRTIVPNEGNDILFQNE